MTYDEIMTISDIEKKEEKLIEFYTKEIGVNEWLVDDTKNQKIRFKDRFEYKTDGVYHRLTGPAIDFHDKSKRGFYYLFGESMNEMDWKPIAQKYLREKKLKRTLKEE